MSLNQTPEDFNRKTEASSSLGDSTHENTKSSKSFDLARKLASPIILAASALSVNVAAQGAPSSQDILREAEQIGKQAEIETKRAAALLTIQGILLKIQGNLEEAKKMFNQALKIDPTNKDAQESLERVNDEIKKKKI